MVFPSSPRVTPGDFKSEDLRDILREVLNDIETFSLMEDQLSVIETDNTFKEDAELNLDGERCAISFYPRAQQLCGESDQQSRPWICTDGESSRADRPPETNTCSYIATPRCYATA